MIGYRHLPDDKAKSAAHLPNSGSLPPTLAAIGPDTAERVVRTTLSILIATSLVASLFGAVVGVPKTIVLGTLGALVNGALLALLRPKREQVIAMVASLNVMAIAAYGIISGRGLHDVTVMLLPLLVMVATVLLRRRLAMALIAATVAFVVGIGVAQYLGLFNPKGGVRLDVDDIAVICAFLIATAALMRSLVDSLHRSLAEARASEQSYREIFDATAEAIVIFDAVTHKIVDANEAALKQTGYDREELLGLSAGAFSAESGPYSRDRAVTLLKEAIEQGPVTVEWHAHGKHGRQRWVEITYKSTEIRGRPHVLAVVRDIEVRKGMEAELRQAEKLQAVGRLAGGVAHDFNNQLTVIMAGADLLRRRLSDPASKELAAAIVQCSRRSADLTQQLLAFARRGKQSNQVVDLNELVGEVASLLELGLDKRISITRELHSEPLATLGDPSLLQNALMNLGLNARDAMPEGGRLTLSTRMKALSIDEAESQRLGLADGEYVCVSVTDTGFGMDEATQAQVFEPFFTTKHNGTGMGLPAVYGTVKSHGGAVRVISKPACGTTMELWLPRVPSLLEPQAEQSEVRPGLSLAGRRVLVVDDDPNVARAAERILEQLGCASTVLHSSVVALKTFSAERFDAAIVDRIMPELSGDELVQEIRAVAPRFPIVIVSGYSDLPSRYDTPFVQFVPKPFTLRSLRSALLKVIDQSS